MSKTIMLIHGAWLSPASWEHFKARYEASGYTVTAPAWPFEDRPVSQLRQSPRPEVAHLTVSAIVDHYEKLIRALPEPPILIGHSFGGLFVQLLLDRGLGVVGVAIDPAAPRGVPPTLTALYGALPIFLAWRGWSRTLTMTLPQFAWSFVNTLPRAAQKEAYDRYVVPTPGRIYYQAAIGAETAINFRNGSRAPLLLIAGGKDRTVSRSMVEKTFHKYQVSTAVTDLHVFDDRPHLLVAVPGWEDVADYALGWAETHLRKETGPNGIAIKTAHA